MKLISSESLIPTLREILASISRRLSVLVPAGEFHHIGATAIPGAVTKGDLDVLLRVDAESFDLAVRRLKDSFIVKQPQNWTGTFASFGDDGSYCLPVGVQVVVMDSESDFFLFLHDYFTSDAAHIEAYNRIKQQSAPLGDEEYWSAKDRFLSPIIASRPKHA